MRVQNEHSEKGSVSGGGGAEGAETPAEEENKRATASRWKRFCDICQDVIIAGLAKASGF